MQYEFISYSEEKFNRILRMDGISRENLLKSLDIESNKESILKAGEGAGASGSFFFFSSDNRFLIKTMNSAEKNKCLKMLNSMIEHLEATGNKSLIARIYGIYTLKTLQFVPVDLMIMQNTSLLFNKVDKHMSFDLKGSTVNRHTKVNVNKVKS